MLGEFLSNEGIANYAVIPFADCRVLRAHKLDELPAAQSVCVCLIPYYTKTEGNIARFAMPRDYHAYFAALLERARTALPDLIGGFCDDSPFADVEAAVSGGLGLRGRNGLLIHETYGSYVLIGTLLFSAALPVRKHAPPSNICADCRACERACPGDCILGGKLERCLSRLSQRKSLTPAEEAVLGQNAVVWGCDVCQQVCPHNFSVPETPVAFFKENLIPVLSEELLDCLVAEGEYDRRAYSFRPPEVLKRNLRLQKS